MKFEVIAKTIAAGAVAMLIAGCGGGGGDNSATSSSVLLSGTAATGAALANATVDVKCAAGTGTATTNTTGGYTVTVTDGKLPCIVKVSGTNSNGVAVTLHSIADAGSASGSDVTATANVTPVTEMIVAQLLAALPAEGFASFNPALVTPEALDKAADTIVAALKTAGIDLGAIDPLKDPLVPATGTTAGNAYDVLLDNLATKVGPEALPLVVSQIANAATTNSTEGLTNAIAAVAGGTLEGCASAISGKYRVIDYTGAMQVVQIDFSAMKVTDSDGTQIGVTASTTQACEINVEDGNGTQVVFGPSGLGALRDNYTTGYVIPLQTLAFADIQSEWTFVESGKEESGAVVHFAGKIKFNADRSISLCEYDVAGGITSTCTPDTETGTVADGTDGGLVLNYGDAPAKFYGYRTPSGKLNLFGTNNPTGSTAAVMRTHFVAVQPESVPMPQLNEVRTSWGLLMRTGTGGALFSAPLTRDKQTITKVDTANSTYTRVFEGSSLEDIFMVNKPLTGMVERNNRSPIYAIAIPGTGVTVAINAPGNTFLYSTTVSRP